MNTGMKMSVSTRFLLVGIGPANIAMAHALTSSGVDAGDILAIDGRAPMSWLAHCVSSIGMREMRSGWEISVVDSADALRGFAASLGRSYGAPTPSWDIFSQHALTVWHSMGISQIPFSVERLARWGDRWLFGFGNGHGLVEADVAIIATGLRPHRRTPIEGAIPLPLVKNADGLMGANKVAIVGAGLTAAHTAVFMAENGIDVTLFAPRGLRDAERDARMEWFDDLRYDSGFGSRNDGERMRGELRKLDPKGRYKLIKSGAQPGTITADMHQKLQRFITRHAIKILNARIATSESAERGGRMVVDEKGDRHGPFGVVYDARGFRVHVSNLRDGIDGLRRQIGRRHFRGLPVFGDPTCQIKPGLVLAGALTAMEYGPIAHTLAGPVAHARTLANAFVGH